MPLPDSPDAFPPDRFVLRYGERTLDLRPGAGPPKVMGILNVTPDSFSDGGAFLEKDDALQRVETMLDEGADVIDVGGESSRPAGSVYGEGAATVDAEEEKRRVLPVVEAVAELLDARGSGALLSVDTYKPGVARAALAAGAHVINDITGLRVHPETAAVCAEFGAPLVVMHSRGRPGALPHARENARDGSGDTSDNSPDDIVRGVTETLAASVKAAEDAGVAQVVVDPGFGFGKAHNENLRLLAASGHFLRTLERPVLVGLSRKSTIGAALGERAGRSEAVPVGERLFGSLGATAAAAAYGATLVRTHDVRSTVEMLHLFAAVLDQGTALTPAGALSR